MRRNVCRLAAVAVGLCGWVGSAAATDPLVVISPAPVAADALPPAQQSYGGVVPVSGCANCAPAGGGGKLASHGYGWLIGAGCENQVSCGSLASQRTFFFGSCRQFYNPGNDCSGPHCFRGQQMIYGPGGLGLHNNCEYGSFNNR